MYLIECPEMPMFTGCFRFFWSFEGAMPMWGQPAGQARAKPGDNGSNHLTTTPA
jgi:hypothetical protein